MAWIKTIGLKDAELTTELAAVYQELAPHVPAEYRMGDGDDVGSITKSHSLDPAALRTVFGGGLHLISGPSPLSRRDREMINTVVSAANRCFY
jgi:hypothetical protein